MNEDWDKNDPLWKTLGHTPEVRVSPFFARRVRHSLPSRRPIWPGVLRWASAGVLGVCALGFWLSLEHSAARSGRAEFTAAFDAVAGIDAMVAASTQSTEEVLVY